VLSSGAGGGESDTGTSFRCFASSSPALHYFCTSLQNEQAPITSHFTSYTNQLTPHSIHLHPPFPSPPRPRLATRAIRSSSLLFSLLTPQEQRHTTLEALWRWHAVLQAQRTPQLGESDGRKEGGAQHLETTGVEARGQVGVAVHVSWEHS